MSVENIIESFLREDNTSKSQNSDKAKTVHRVGDATHFKNIAVTMLYKKKYEQFHLCN